MDAKDPPALPTPPAAPAASAAARRTRYASTTAILVAASTAIAVILAALATRYNVRLDVTAAREHTLADRTRGVLGRLGSRVEIIVSAEFGALDADSRARGFDLLEAFDSASGLIEVVTIDVGAADAPDRIGAVVARIADARSADVAAHDAAVANAAEDLRALADRAERLLAPIERLTASLPASDPIGSRLAGEAERDLALTAADLRTAAGQIDAKAWLETGGVRLAQADVAEQAASDPLQRASLYLGALDRIAFTPLTAHPDDAIAAMAQQLAAAALDGRETAARALDRLQGLEPLEPVIASRLLSSTQTILLASSAGLSAVELGAVFAPPSAGAHAAGPALDPRARGEDLITTAIGALDDERRPIVIYVHAGSTRLFQAAGRPTPGAASRLGAAVERLALRRIDVLEWAVALDQSPPDLTRIDPGRERHGVWLIAPPPSTGDVRADAFGDSRLVDATSILLDAGENLLISAAPSINPAAGAEDPFAALLGPLGVEIDTGRPIITRVSHPTRVVVNTYQRIRETIEGQAVAEAVDGLLTVLNFALPIAAPDPPEGVRFTPILRTPDDAEAWAEARWRALRGLSARRPFEMLEPPDPPTMSPARDDPNGPWVVAAAVERERERVPRPELRHTPASTGPQRLIIVGAADWYENPSLLAGGPVAGRFAAAFPGNAELFENAIYWLADRDELVAPSPRARETPRVGPLTPSQHTLIRWLLIAGLPALVLAAGGAQRIIRG